jgi:hypothetical protein
MMSDDLESPDVTAQVRVMQIIVAALSVGVLSFGGFVLATGSGAEKAEPEILTLGSIVLAVVGGAMSFVLPALVVSRNRRSIASGTWPAASGNQPRQAVPDTDAGKLLAVYQTQLIIGAALLEGPAFVGLLAYMLEGHWAGLLVGAVCLLALMAKFPTRHGVQGWLDQQMQQIKEQRQFGLR